MDEFDDNRFMKVMKWCSDDVPLSVKTLVGCNDCVGCKSDVSRRQPVVQFMVLNKL